MPGQRAPGEETAAALSPSPANRSTRRSGEKPFLHAGPGCACGAGACRPLLRVGRQSPGCLASAALRAPRARKDGWSGEVLRLPEGVRAGAARREVRGRRTTALSPVGRRGDGQLLSPQRRLAFPRQPPALRVAFLWPVHFLPGSGFALRALCSCESVPGARVPRRPRQGGARKPESRPHLPSLPCGRHSATRVQLARIPRFHSGLGLGLGLGWHRP